MRDRLLLPRPGIRMPTGITRRGFLAGVAATGLLVACSDDDSGARGDGDQPGGAGGIAGGLSAARFYGPYYAAGQPARVPFGLADDEGLLSEELAPAEVGITVRSPEAEEVASGITAPLHTGGLPRPYYAFEFTPETAGFYDVTIDTGDDTGEVITQMQVVEADDPTVTSIVGPGDTLPPVQTPTVDDARGVTPICTRATPCDLHSRTVADVLAAGEPMALLVSTPAFCQTAICGPVLDVLLGLLPEVPGIAAVHAEVYADPESGEHPMAFAPVIDELGLPFEPVLYTVGADGVVRGRLDYIFGEEEMRQTLQGLAA